MPFTEMYNAGGEKNRFKQETDLGLRLLWGIQVGVSSRQLEGGSATAEIGALHSLTDAVPCVSAPDVTSSLITSVCDSA